MAKIKVEKKELPDRHYSRGRKYPWDDMKVGDSFLVDRSKEAGVRGAVRAYKIRHPDWNCRVFKVEDGIRVWRVS